MNFPKDRLRKIYGITEPTGPTDPVVLARRKYHEAAAKWLAKWLVPLQVFFAVIGFFVVLLPVLSKSWRSIVEGLPFFSKVFLDYSTFGGLAIIHLYIGLAMAFTKPYLVKYSPSGDVVPYKNGIAPLLCPRTRKEEVSFWIEVAALIMVASVWLFLPFGVLGYFMNPGR